ncbi:unnamed protein product, partial [Ascophyllum nodosum]
FHGLRGDTFGAGSGGVGWLPMEGFSTPTRLSDVVEGIYLNIRTGVNEWRTIISRIHKIRLHGRRGKGTAESFSREKLSRGPRTVAASWNGAAACAWGRISSRQLGDARWGSWRGQINPSSAVGGAA